MKIETYKRKLQELQAKIKNTNPRYVNKIAEMKEEAKELRRKIKELEEKEKSPSTSENKKRNNVKKHIQRVKRQKDKSKIIDHYQDECPELGDEYRGWEIVIKGTYIKVLKAGDFLLDFTWERLKNQIDEIEDKAERERKKLYSQVGQYHGWKITEYGKDNIIAKKRERREIIAGFGQNIRNLIDEYEKTEEIVYKDSYKGWKITKRSGDSAYAAEKKGAHNKLTEDSLTLLKESIDNEETLIKKEKKIFAHPESFSENYKGWIITINDNKLTATKEKKEINSYCLKEYGLESARDSLHYDIDKYENNPNPEPDDDILYINPFKEGLEFY